MRNGTAPYTYSWVNTEQQEEGNGVFLEDAEKLTELPAGKYLVSITDANGNSINKEVFLKQAENIRITKDIEGPSCPSDPTGRAILAPATEGVSLSYLWEDGSTANELSGVVAGDYKVTITDDNNCQIIETIQLENPDALRNSFTVNNCGEGETTIVASVENGQTPYTYIWNSGETTKLLSNKEAGVYTVTITDAKGCQKVDSIVMEEVAPLMVEFDVKDITCGGANDGSIVANVTGGSSNMTYEWNGEITDKDISGLSAGDYSLQVFFAGCQRSFAMTINEPLPLIAEGRQIKKEDDTWQVMLEIEGGITPYEINWSNGSTGFVIEGQELGTELTFSIKDANGCTYSDNIQVGIGTVGISDELTNLLEFNLFPNPTDNQLNVLVGFPQQVDANIEIFDVTGRIMKRQSFETATIATSFDVSQFASGTYWLKLSSNGKIASKKFVVH